MIEAFYKILGIGVLAVAIAFAFAFSAIAAYPVMLLWNSEIFELKAIDFGQALALSLLCSALLKTSSSSTTSK